jgi:hypothetical protein
MPTMGMMLMVMPHCDCTVFTSVMAMTSRDASIHLVCTGVGARFAVGSAVGRDVSGVNRFANAWCLKRRWLGTKGMMSSWAT